MQNVQRAACSQRACVIDACPYKSQSTENLQQLELITPAASKRDQAAKQQHACQLRELKKVRAVQRLASREK